MSKPKTATAPQYIELMTKNMPGQRESLFSFRFKKRFAIPFESLQDHVYNGYRYPTFFPIGLKGGFKRSSYVV